jgi:hypothetical protein
MRDHCWHGLNFTPIDLSPTIRRPLPHGEGPDRGTIAERPLETHRQGQGGERTL